MSGFLRELGLIQMDIMAAPVGGDQSSFGRRAKGMLPFAIALLIHVLLFAALLSTRPPLVGHAVQAVDISLLPGPGAGTILTPIPKLLRPFQPAAAPKPTAANPAASKEQAVGSFTPKPKLIVQGPADLETLVTDLAKGGLHLTANPVSVVAPPTAVAKTPSQTDSGNSCQIEASLQASLQGSREAKTALSQIPAGSRSVANAILLWDGRWIDSSSVGGLAAFGPVEQAIAEVINQASPALSG